MCNMTWPCLSMGSLCSRNTSSVGQTFLIKEPRSSMTPPIVHKYYPHLPFLTLPQKTRGTIPSNDLPSPAYAIHTKLYCIKLAIHKSHSCLESCCTQMSIPPVLIFYQQLLSIPAIVIWKQLLCLTHLNCDDRKLLHTHYKYVSHLPNTQDIFQPASALHPQRFGILSPPT